LACRSERSTMQNGSRWLPFSFAAGLQAGAEPGQQQRSTQGEAAEVVEEAVDALGRFIQQRSLFVELVQLAFRSQAGYGALLAQAGGQQQPVAGGGEEQGKAVHRLGGVVR